MVSVLASSAINCGYELRSCQTKEYKIDISVFSAKNVALRWTNNSHWVDMSLHSDTLFWFRANQSLLFLRNAAFLAEKQQISILYSFVWQDRSSYPQFIALEARTLTITLSMRFPIVILLLLYISTQWLLLVHLAKGNVSFYHHLAAVVRCLSFVVWRQLTIHILIFSSETL
jgi:hypothetical protein